MKDRIMKFINYTYRDIAVWLRKGESKDHDELLFDIPSQSIFEVKNPTFRKDQLRFIMEGQKMKRMTITDLVIREV